MALFDNFPWTNLHELNLDWVIRTVKEAAERAGISVEETEKMLKNVEITIKNSEDATKEATSSADRAIEITETATKELARISKEFDSELNIIDGALENVTSAISEAESATAEARLAAETIDSKIQNAGSIINPVFDDFVNGAQLYKDNSIWTLGDFIGGAVLVDISRCDIKPLTAFTFCNKHFLAGKLDSVIRRIPSSIILQDGAPISCETVLFQDGKCNIIAGDATLNRNAFLYVPFIYTKNLVRSVTE